MREGTENHGDSWSLADYLSSVNKGKNHTAQQRSMPHYLSVLQETPMKPSQITNRLSQPPPRRALPLQSPEMCHRERLGALRQPTHCLGPSHLAGCVSRSPVSCGTPLKTSWSTPVNRSGPAKSAALPQRPKSSPQTLQATSHLTSPDGRKDLRKHISHTEKDKLKTDKASSTSERQTRDSTMDRHVETPSKRITANSSSSSQKRRRESEDCHLDAKKRSLQRTSSLKGHTPSSADTSRTVSLVSETSTRRSSVLELSSKNTDLCTKPVCGRSSSLPGKPRQSSCTSLSTKCVNRRPSMGAKQVFVDFAQAANSPCIYISSQYSSQSKQNSKSQSLSCRMVERNKTSRQRKHVAVPDNIDELFTPDPKTYVVCPPQKSVKPKMEARRIGSTTTEKTSSSISRDPCSRPSRVRDHDPTAAGSPSVENTKSSIWSVQSQGSFPFVSLVRLKVDDTYCCEDKFKKNPVTSVSKDESAKTDEKKSPLTTEKKPRSPQHTQMSPSRHSPPLGRQEGGGDGEQGPDMDPVDVELDLGLRFSLGLDLTQSSQSSEEEQLLSLQEIMESVTKLPDTPEKGAFSETSTPVCHSSQSKAQLLSSIPKTGTYKNNLDQMLKEIHIKKKAKENEAQILTACEKELLTISEYDNAMKNQEEEMSTEQQEFLQRYSLTSSAIKDVPPGEVAFNLEKFGQIFNQNTLQLRQCTTSPQTSEQKALLWSSPAQLRLHLNIGLFQEAFNCHSPCPSQVACFLFKMMSVHTERMLSEKLLQALCDIASTAAHQIVKNNSQQFKVWVPSLADVTLVLMNMGVAFVTLFPSENLQPLFTEGDLLEEICINTERSSSNKEHMFPEHNCNNVFKYLSFCMGLCPRAYSDNELLLLLTVVGRVALDPQLILQSRVDLYTLQYKLVNNFRDWDTMLPRMCVALRDLTDDHHNMCLLVQLLPDNTRGKQLRQHLSLSMISKLLRVCRYTPTEKEFQLADLRPYLAHMRPSSLQRVVSSSYSALPEEDDDMDMLDQRSYYLCYSLLTLVNEATNFPLFPADQKKQLLNLCSELETHVKSNIRESGKCLYRSKVKDLVARIDTKWQMLLQQTRPLHNKLCDYWQPSSLDALTCSQDETMDDSNDGQASGAEGDHVMEEDEEAISVEEGEKELGATTHDASELRKTEEQELMEFNQESKTLLKFRSVLSYDSDETFTARRSSM